MVKLSAEVVGVGNLLLIGIDHLQQSVMAVIGSLRHVGGNGLIGHNHRAAGLDDFAHLGYYHNRSSNPITLLQSSISKVFFAFESGKTPLFV